MSGCRAGESPSPPGRQRALLPSREEFVYLWRYLKGQLRRPAPLEDTAHRLARSIARSTGRRETVMRTMVCLEVLGRAGAHPGWSTPPTTCTSPCSSSGAARWIWRIPAFMREICGRLLSDG